MKKTQNEYNVGNLIDSCGVYFRTLILHTQYKKKLLEPWEAVPNKKINSKVKSKKGKTAGEAIYRLLLEINKNTLTKGNGTNENEIPPNEI